MSWYDTRPITERDQSPTISTVVITHTEYIVGSVAGIRHVLFVCFGNIERGYMPFYSTNGCTRNGAVTRATEQGYNWAKGTAQKLYDTRRAELDAMMEGL